MLFFLHILFTIYTMIIAIRTIGSWFPSWWNYRWYGFVAKLADPYLNLFRRFIPPIGGFLDLSPMVAFFFLQLMEQMIFRLIR